MKLGKITFFLIFIFLFAGLFCGIFIGKNLIKKNVFHLKTVHEKGFRFTNPLLYIELPEENEQGILQLKYELNTYINQAVNNNLAENISVNARLSSLFDWIVINGEEKYSPASLLKVPVMMEYYKQSEIDPSLFSSSITDNISDDNLQQNFKPQQQIEQGQSYSVDELVKRMIVYSDNDAEDLLTANMNEKDFDEIFDNLEINRIDYKNQENSMDVITYAYFFRVLYNGTFLSPQDSEKALQLLTQTTFTQGIVAGVPKNITVAHKFGERKFADTGETQLHDCGIVYFPKNPYILCIMTRGKSFTSLETVLKQISSITYNFVKTHLRQK